jgi:hypothetical protein
VTNIVTNIVTGTGNDRGAVAGHQPQLGDLQ